MKNDNFITMINKNTDSNMDEDIYFEKDTNNINNGYPIIKCEIDL